MSGGIFLLAEEERCCKDCGLGVCGDVRAGNASTVASALPGAYPGDICRQGAYRHYICVVGFSTLRSGQLHRLVMDELWVEILRPDKSGLRMTHEDNHDNKGLETLH